LLPLIRRINAYILKWARKKYKRLASFTRAKAWWTAVTKPESVDQPGSVVGVGYEESAL